MKTLTPEDIEAYRNDALVKGPQAKEPWAVSLNGITNAICNDALEAIKMRKELQDLREPRP